MLVIPEHIEIQLTTSAGVPYKQSNVIVGIHSFATRKNDIELSPFISDKNGIITITKDQIIERARNFISYGIMDYNSLESAKSTVELFIWTKDKIQRYLNYWEPLVKENPTKNLADWQIRVMDKEMLAIQEREQNEVELIKKSHNANSISKEFKIKMTWDGKETNFRITFIVK